MGQEGGSEHMLGICDALLLGLAAGSRGSFAVNEGRHFKKGKQDFGNFEHERKPSECPSRKAVMARMNHLKKKNFLESLRTDFARLSDENAKLRQKVESRPLLVCSLRKEVNYLKGVLANCKEISMLIKSIHNTELPVTSSLSKQSPINQMHSTADHNYIYTGSDSSIATSFDGLFVKDSAILASDVSLSLAMPPDNTLDLPVLSLSERDLCDTQSSGCYSAQPTIFNSPVAGSAGDDELLIDFSYMLACCQEEGIIGIL
jgi:hypothetical protein